jgi:myo-inositol-hexaphosphate 3-phosphohydrolase
MPTTTSVNDPFGLAFVSAATERTEQHNIFRSADGHVRALWFNFAGGKWHREDRSTFAPAIPPSVGDTSGYTIVNEKTGVTEQHNLFRSADGHVHALWFSFDAGWHHEDRSTFAPGIPHSLGDPFGYAVVNEKTGVTEQHNLFRSADGHIHALWFSFAEGKWHHEDRSTFAPGVPASEGDPFGYAVVNEKTGVTEQHNLFRSADGHIHALWFSFAEGKWHHEDRSTFAPGVPASAGDPFGYAVVNEKTGVTEQHNLFRSADGHIHALWFSFAEGKWHHEDRSTFAPGIPPSLGDPFGYVVVNEKMGVTEQHNLFRSADGHIHALWFSFAEGKWHHEDRSTFALGVPASVGEPFGYAVVNEKTGVTEQHNLFRSADGHIHALWFSFAEGKWHHEDRSAFAQPDITVRPLRDEQHGQFLDVTGVDFTPRQNAKLDFRITAGGAPTTTTSGDATVATDGAGGFNHRIGVDLRGVSAFHVTAIDLATNDTVEKEG